MSCVAGILPASKGSIFFEGNEITRLDAPERFAKGISLSPEGGQVFPDLTVYENLDLGAYLRTASEK